MKSKPETPADHPGELETLLLDLALIDEESNLRPSQDEQSPEMDELTLSIQAHGTLLQAVGVCQRGNRYELLFGARRLCAARRAGLDRVPARLFPVPEDEAALQILQLLENSHRMNLEPLQFAQALSRIKQARQWTNEELSRQVHLHPTKVCRLLDLAQQPEDILQAVERGLSMTTALELGRLPEVERAKLLPLAAAGRLGRDELARRRRQARVSPGPRRSKPARVTAKLSQDQSVTVVGPDLSLDRFISVLEDLLGRAKRVRTQKWSLATFIKALDDQLRSSSPSVEQSSM